MVSRVSSLLSAERIPANHNPNHFWANPWLYPPFPASCPFRVAHKQPSSPPPSSTPACSFPGKGGGILSNDHLCIVLGRNTEFKETKGTSGLVGRLDAFVKVPGITPLSDDPVYAQSNNKVEAKPQPISATSQKGSQSSVRHSGFQPGFFVPVRFGQNRYQNLQC